MKKTPRKKHEKKCTKKMHFIRRRVHVFLSRIWTARTLHTWARGNDAARTLYHRMSTNRTNTNITCAKLHSRRIVFVCKRGWQTSLSKHTTVKTGELGRYRHRTTYCTSCCVVSAPEKKKKNDKDGFTFPSLTVTIHWQSTAAATAGLSNGAQMRFDYGGGGRGETQATRARKGGSIAQCESATISRADRLTKNKDKFVLAGENQRPWTRANVRRTSDPRNARTLEPCARERGTPQLGVSPWPKPKNPLMQQRVCGSRQGEYGCVFKIFVCWCVFYVPVSVCVFLSNYGNPCMSCLRNRGWVGGL